MGLMTEQGYEALTIARLAKELDYAVGALYRYFKGKDAILAALQVRCVNRISEDLLKVREILAEQPGEYSEGERELVHVLAGLGVYESLTFRRPTDYRLLTLSLGDPRELLATDMASVVYAPLNDVLGMVAEHLEKAASLGAIHEGSAETRIVVLWGATQGVIQLRKMSRVDPKLGDRSLTDALLCGQLIGWGADPSKVEAFQVRAREVVDALDTSVV